MRPELPQYQRVIRQTAMGWSQLPRKTGLQLFCGTYPITLHRIFFMSFRDIKNSAKNISGRRWNCAICLIIAQALVVHWCNYFPSRYCPGNRSYGLVWCWTPSTKCAKRLVLWLWVLPTNQTEEAICFRQCTEEMESPDSCIAAATPSGLFPYGLWSTSYRADIYDLGYFCWRMVTLRQCVNPGNSRESEQDSRD